MTPAAFESTYGPAAATLAARFGLDPDLFLAQWAVETGWGTAWAGAPCNLGNIEVGPGVFAQYPTIAAFLDAATAVLNQPNMAMIKAAAGGDVIDQMAALGDSPWDAGHYVTANPAFNNQPLVRGSALHERWEALRMSLLTTILSYCRSNYDLALKGTDTEGGYNRDGYAKTVVLPAITGIPHAAGTFTDQDRAELQEAHDAVLAAAPKLTDIQQHVDKDLA